VRVAFVTYSGLPGLSADDQPLVPALETRGVAAEAAAWDDPAVAWDAYDALVIRSTWNYHTAFTDFTAWIARVESLGVPTWNPPEVLRWNASKTYLRDLAARGIDVVPTRWVERGSEATISAVLTEAGWPDAVVKPAISASAYETWRVAADRVTPDVESRFRDLTRRGDVMVQPFLTELARDGEWSLMFIGGEYSHAVLKRPRAGDFRVQHEHGGSVESRDVPAHLVDAAHAAVESARSPLLYARVDGCEIDSRFVLMELELLEPSLFLGSAPGAAERFAEAMVELLGTGNSGDSRAASGAR
jgi:glutathione synthase/RimK-type ligase-like ATP-grasp enzyme